MNCSEIDLDSPAIRALGSLFKITEVLLWDDDGPRGNLQVSSYPKHIRFKYDSDGNEDDQSSGAIISNISVEITEDSIVTEGAGLSHQMKALGLPGSFQTSKQRSGQTKGKSKTTQLTEQCNQKQLEGQVLESAKVRMDSLYNADSSEKSSNSSSLSFSDQIEPSCSGSAVADDMIRLSNFSEGDNMMTGPACALSEDLATVCDPTEEHNHDCVSTTLQIEYEMIPLASRSNICTGNTFPESYELDDDLEHNRNYMDISFTKQIDIGNSELDDDLEHNRNTMDISFTKQIDIGSSELGHSVMQTKGPMSSNTIEQTQVADFYKESQNISVHASDESKNIGCTSTSVDWSPFWDSFYTRYYFYNAKTQESTWYPPPGMENFSVGDVSCVSSGLNEQLVSGVEQGQADGCELVAKINSDEKTVGSSLAECLFAGDLSSASVLLHDEILLDSTSEPVDLCNSLEEERKDVDFDEICSDSKSKDFPGNIPDAYDNCENVDRNNGDNVIADISNFSSCLTPAAIEASDGDFMSQTQKVPVTTKQKKKRRNRRRKLLCNDNKDDDECQMVKDLEVDITKYWWQRYLLFSRFDDGIKMDKEGWFSVTPEAIAIHQASRCCAGVVIDCFAGVGGNAIQFAKKSKRVIALDIDPTKIDCAHHNASIYGVEDKIDFIIGDSFSLASKLKADTVFLSPPWGGPDYMKVDLYDIDMLQPYDGKFLFNTFKEVASMIIMFLPRNVNVAQLAEISLSANPPWLLEVERNFLNDRLKGVTAYFSKTSGPNN